MHRVGILILMLLTTIGSAETGGSSEVAHKADIILRNLMTDRPITFSQTDLNAKVRVLVFISTKCAATSSHLELIKKMAIDYQAFSFLGVHSNADETAAEARKYFQGYRLPFDIVRDDDAKIADLFKVSKTPHIVILNSRGEIIYNGGMTDSMSTKRAKNNFLQSALSDLAAGRDIKIKETRTLGCVILRQEDLK